MRAGRFAVVRRRWKAIVAFFGVLLLGVLALGFAYAGLLTSSPTASPSPTRMSAVSRLPTPKRELSTRAQALSSEPVVFTGAGRRWSIAPAQLAVRGDWGGAATEALDHGDGPVPLRGLKRLELRLFGSEVEPSATVDQGALNRQLRVIAKQVEVDGREAAIVLRNDEPVVIPGEASRALETDAAATTMVSALAALEREGPVALPIKATPPAVGRDALAAVAQQVHGPLGAPSSSSYKDFASSVTPEQIASFLNCRTTGNGSSVSAVPRPRSTSHNLAAGVGRAPREVDFTSTSLAAVPR